MKYEITITADTNDADYITAVNPISEKELELIKPLISAIKKFKPYKVKYNRSWGKHEEATSTHHHNYPIGDCLRGDMGEKSPEELYKFDSEVFELFEEYLPYSEYGIHTIASVTICPLQEKIKLL